MIKSKQIAYDVQSTVSRHVDEQKTEVNVTIKSGVKRVSLPDNVMVFQAFAYLAATKLKPSTNKVLMLLFSYSAYENFIGVDVKTMGEVLCMSKPSVISAINELVNNNIVIKTTNVTDRRRHDYFLNPIAVWKGNSYTRMRVLKKADPEQLTMFNDDHSESPISPINSFKNA